MDLNKPVPALLLDRGCSLPPTTGLPSPYLETGKEDGLNCCLQPRQSNCFPRSPRPYLPGRHDPKEQSQGLNPGFCFVFVFEVLLLGLELQRAALIQFAKQKLFSQVHNYEIARNVSGPSLSTA